MGSLVGDPRPTSLHRLFEAQARRAPDAVAVVAGDERSSYGELDARSNRLARWLLKLGVDSGAERPGGREARVAICLDRTLDLWLAPLGVLKAGCAFLPMDPAHPPRRLAAVLRDARPRMLLTRNREELAPEVLRSAARNGVEVVSLDEGKHAMAAEFGESLPCSGHPERLAYVIYTSGSTGRPKGVEVPHAAVINFLTSMARRPGLASGDVLLSLTTPAFDIFVLELFLPLVVGACAVVVSREVSIDGARLARTITATSATVVQATPATWSLLSEAGFSGRPGLRVFCGGEALSRALGDQLRRWSPEVWNLYGPTEATVWAAVHRSTAGERSPTVPIGRAIARTSLHLLDSGGEPVAQDEVGELSIAGRCLARGYLGRPARTAAVFVPDASSSTDEVATSEVGGRRYLTGDRVRRLPGGGLEFLGRIDHQVKVRGFRIELGEVEAALAEHPAVDGAVVLARRRGGGAARPGSDTVLVAHLLSRRASSPSTDALRRLLGDRLPGYMVPAAFVFHRRWPLTARGKVDRRALARSRVNQGPEGLPRPVLANPLARRVAKVWRQVLGVDRISLRDSFFELGGDSLAAARVISRLRAALGVELPLRRLFERPTLAQVVADLEASRRREPRARAVPLERVSRSAPLPLSFAQHRLWFLHQLAPRSPAYNLPEFFRLRGALRLAALAAAVDEIVRRHEVLRTRFAIVGDRPVQVIAPAARQRLGVVDLERPTADAALQEALRLARDEALRPFDLARGPVLRVSLVRFDAQDHILAIHLHHVASDGWSQGVLRRELAELYGFFASAPGAGGAFTGAPGVAPLPELPIQYADFAAWQRRRLDDEVLEAPLRYWRRQLDGLSATRLPADRPRAGRRGCRGVARRLEIPRTLARSLKDLSLAAGTSFYMTLLAAFMAWLSRLTGQTEVVVGSPFAHRERSETERMIGFFVNMLVMRGDLAEAAGRPLDFRGLLERVRDLALGAYEHRDVPFERVVEELHPERDLDRHPLFQIVFAQQDPPGSRLELQGLEASPVAGVSPIARFDLAFHVWEGSAPTPDGEDDASGCFVGDADLFDAPTLARWSGHFTHLLEQVTARPGRRLTELSILARSERHQLLLEWSAGAEADRPPSRCLHELFEDQVARTPDAPAAVFGEAVLTYRRLDRRSTGLARHLRTLGVGGEKVVGICLERGLEMVVALLGVLKAGGAYLPLHPGDPPGRRAALLEDSGAVAVLAGGEPVPGSPVPVVSLDRSFAGCGTDGDRWPCAAPSQAAYVIYTSGSSGRPKGVVVEHRQIVSYVTAIRARLGLGEGASFAMVQPLSVDSCKTSIFPPLTSGGCLHVVKEHEATDASAVRRLFGRRRPDVLKIAPTHLAALTEDAAGEVLPRRSLVIGGETLRRDRAARWWRAAGGSGCRIYNHYGPTEATVGTHLLCLARGVATGGPPAVAIGHPLGHALSYVADCRLRLMPVGVAGELLAGGACVTRGYAGRPGSTAERYVPDPWSGTAGQRLYRTGDLARALPNGAIELLGRRDDQVKIQGFRVEPGEVEAVLAALPEVAEAVVLTRRSRRRPPVLVACVVASRPPGTTAAELRARLEAKLPRPMVPAAFAVLETLPRTAHGKVDRAALARASVGPARPREGADPPRGAFEELLASTWSRILLDRRPAASVGRGDNFFALGGHSLDATRLMSRVRQLFGVELPLESLFEAPTVAGLAARVEAAVRSAGGLSVPAIRPAVRGARPPLAFAQQRLWFLHQLEPESPAYNQPSAYRLRGRLRVRVFEAAFRDVCRRHEALRTTFASHDGRPYQVIAPAPDVRLSVVDLAGLAAGRRRDEAERLRREEALRPFDLERGPLLRIVLLRAAVQDHRLLLSLHHVVSDGWSRGVLFSELAALYRHRMRHGPAPVPDPLPRLPIQYADFAVWQRRWLVGEPLAAQLDYWRRQLAGLRPLDLPTDRPRPAVRSYRGASCDFQLAGGVRAALERLSLRRGVSLYMTLLAGFLVLLGRSTGRRDPAVGSPIANRNRREIEGLIGFFVNMLVMRGDLRPSRAGGPLDFEALLRRVRRTALDAFAHQDLPFEKLVEELQPERDPNRHPLFQVTFALHNAPGFEIALPDLEVTPDDRELAAGRFDLELHLWQLESEAGLRGRFIYSSDLFDATTLGRFAGHFRTLMEAIARRPDADLDELAWIGRAQRHQLLVEWNATATELPGGLSLHRLFEAQVERTPEAVAVVDEDQTLSYRELDRRAERVARQLEAAGVGPETPVGVCVERSTELVIALLGVLEAGGAYVPLDPSYPRQRLAFMLADCRAPVLLTGECRRAGLAGPQVEVLDLERLIEEPAAGGPPRARLSGLHPAYVLYTSGSTGRPKGAVVSHRAICNHMLWMQAALPLDGSDRVLQKTPASFDASVWEFFAPLFVGARLVMARPGGHRDPGYLVETICRHRVTILQVVPSLLRMLVDEPGLGRCCDLRRVLSGGERLSELRDRFFASGVGAELYNVYGPTEATIHASYRRCRPLAPRERGAAAEVIGRPIDNARIDLADRELRWMPSGLPGQLCVGGEGLARGYLGRPALTAERFVPDPSAASAGGRAYLSGDLARRLATGELEFLGRLDRQVKNRGYRIEPGEIEAALVARPEARQAAVVARREGPGRTRLTAYVVAGDRRPEGLAGEHVARWREVYETLYGQRPEPANGDAAFDTVGWNSSFTGEPIPATEMREWVEQTVGRILALEPRRVLEIGCGTGLLLRRVAPRCTRYVGTDFSRAVLADLASGLDGELPQVRLLERSAEDFTGFEAGSFDTVVLSSVVQYFPDMNYLVRVLEGAVRVLSPGSHVFLGDLRSLPLLDAFCASVELYRAPGSLPVAELRERVARRRGEEEELVVDPRFFAALRRRLPEVAAARVWPKIGRGDNELTRFRYDVVLDVDVDGEAPAARPRRPDVSRLDWRGDRLCLGGLERRLTRDRPPALVVTGVPNARVAREVQLLAMLDGGNGGVAAAPVRTTADLRAALREPAVAGVDPEDLRRLGDELSYDLELSWSDGAADGSYVAAFSRPGTAASLDGEGLSRVPKPWHVYGSDPLKKRAARKWVPRLRRELGRRLPEYMVPDDFVWLEALPTLPSGKVDRAALARLPPPQNGRRRELESARVAPRTATEEILAGIWSEVLGRGEVGIRDNFFEFGGHSLNATRVVSRIRRSFDTELPLRRLFEHPTIAQLAASLERSRRGAHGLGQPELERPPIRPRVDGREPPLSFAQQRLWFVHQLEPDSSAYNMAMAFRLRGRLEVPALAAALGEIVRRHAVLRTTFAEVDGRPYQVIAPAAAVDLPLVDLERLTASRRLEAGRRLARAAAVRPFDLARGPVLRASVVRLAEREHFLLLGLHHIVSDGWSLGVLYRELGLLYGAFAGTRSAAGAELEDLPIQYADYTVWQREWLTGERLETQLGFWRSQLAGLRPMELPADRPRPAVASGRGASHDFELSPESTRAIERLSLDRRASLYMTLLAAYLAFLSRTSGQRDLVVGSPIAHRNHQEVEGLIGFFVNMLVLRVDLSAAGGERGPTAGEILSRVRRVALDAYAHQDLPFEKLVEDLRPERDPSRHPLFQLSFVLHNTPRSAVRLGELDVRPLDQGPAGARFDLELYMEQVAGRLRGRFVFSTDLYDATTVARFGRRFQVLLRAFVGRPGLCLDELPWMHRSERHQLLVEWNDSRPAIGEVGVLPRLFEARAARTPDAVAAVFPGEGPGAVSVQLSYRRLERRADRLAGFLSARGVGPETRVGLCVDRSPEMIVGLLGILKAGGAYVPLDPSYPEQRLVEVERDSGIAFLLTRGGLDRERLPGPRRIRLDADWHLVRRAGARGPARRPDPDNLAYVIYTSGSTGRPKGVQITHRCLAAFSSSMARRPGLTAADTLLAVTTLGFDIAVLEIFLPLVVGARVVVAGRGTAADPERLAGLLEASRATVMQATPVTWRMLVDAGWPGADRLAILCGGEALPEELMVELTRRGGSTWNLYGPTETTVWSTVRRFDARLATGDAPVGPAAIGRPIAGTRVLLLGRRLEPVALGEVGELCIAGAGVARGYFGRPGLTAERFVPEPSGVEPGSRLYRTGDLARHLADGDLRFLSRIDRQVKVRGHRIEPGEIEAVLRDQPQVREAVVLALDPPPDTRLVACVIAADRHPEGLLDEHLGQWRQVWDTLYGGSADGGARARRNPELDLVGWNSSVTGEPIPEREMREWVQCTVGRLAALEPQRVLEIGCGTGLLLWRIAPRCRRYLATDFSPAVLAELTARIGDRLPQVRLAEKRADRLEDLRGAGFDTVILNSVVQYFPDVDYLLRVLAGAVRATAPGGRVFVGDVRSLPLLDAFCAAIELKRAPDSLPLAELRERVARRREQEEELVVDPRFFLDLRRRLAGIAEVRVLLRDGRFHNELTRFRYDVILRVGGEVPVPPLAGPVAVRRLGGPDEPTLEAVEERLARGRGEALVATRIPNARLSREIRLLELIEAPGVETAADLRRALCASPSAGIDPGMLREIGERHGCAVELSWAAGAVDGSYTAVFHPGGSSAAARVAAALGREARSRGAQSVAANDPLGHRAARQVAPRLRAALRSRLPELMLPSSFVLLDELPLLPNGKVDRAALARRARRVEEGRPELETDFVAPRNDVEKILARTWADVLALDAVGVDDNFFHLGGHSLNATRVLSRVRRTLAVELALRHLFEHPTVAGLASCIESSRSKSSATKSHVTIVPRSRVASRGLPPLTFAQRRLWFLHQLEPESPAYQMATSLRLRGRLDPAALAVALGEIMRRHEVLRTTFPVIDGRPRQRLAPAGTFQLARVDLAGLAPGRRRQEAERLRAADAERPFDLAREIPFRASLLVLEEACHLLLLNAHHIAFDDGSRKLLLRELAVLYGHLVEGRTSPLREPPIQVADYAVWQRDWLTDEAAGAQLAYWKKRLAGLPDLRLPADRPRRPEHDSRTGAAGGTVALELDPALAAALERLSHDAGASRFMTLMAAFMALLSRLTGRRELVVGTPIAHRNHEELEELIGCFVNNLVLRVDLSRDPDCGFLGLLERVRDVALEAYAHQDFPFEKLVEELQPERDLNRNPLFQVFFNMLDPEASAPEKALGAGLTAEPFVAAPGAADERSAAKFDLTLYARERQRTVELSLSYDAGLFDRSRMLRMSRSFHLMLSGVASDPHRRLSEIALLSDAERHQLLVEWSGTPARAAPFRGVSRLFAARARRAPDAIALIFEPPGGRHPEPVRRHWSYAALARRVHRLARRLRFRGVGPEVRVAVCLERSPDLVVALLAVLEAGGAFLVLDPEQPPARSVFLLRDAGARLLLIGGQVSEPPLVDDLEVLDLGAARRRPQREPLQGPLPRPAPSNLAYVVTTSGSSGRPKGVLASHRGVAAYVELIVRTYGLGPGDVVLQLAPVSFDSSLRDLFAPLCAGSRVVLIDADSAKASEGVCEVIERQRATCLPSLVPSRLATLLEALESRPPTTSLRLLLLAGEALAPDLCRRLAALFGTTVRRVNQYGPTEGTGTSSAFDFTTASETMIRSDRWSVSIGRPNPHSPIVILDREMHPVGIGVSGEIYIGGLALARGYSDRPGATARRFVPDPFGGAPGARLYETGDRARTGPAGRLEIRGRLDLQLKIRGVRIEPAEIEAVLLRHPAIVGAAVVARRAAPGSGVTGSRLVAFFVTRRGRPAPDPGALRRCLEAELPRAMVPANLVHLDRLPRTANGKIDRRSLPAAAARPPDLFHAPRSPVEEALSAIWSEVLGSARIDVEESFFELGGHSLLATRVISRVRKVFDVELPLRALFESPTIAGLAERIQDALANGKRPAEVIGPAGKARDFPLSFPQQRLWFLHQLAPESSAYSIPTAYRFVGTLDMTALQRAWREIARRQQSLRTTFPADGGRPRQRIDACRVPALPVVDLRELPPARRRRVARRLRDAEVVRPFDLERGPLFRPLLTRLGPREHVFSICAHHIVTDGWSHANLFRELRICYEAFSRAGRAGARRGTPAPRLPALPIQYSDFTLWQRQRLSTGALESQLCYWKKKLSGHLPRLSLPTDRLRPAAQTGPRGSVSLRLSGATVDRLRCSSSGAGATLFMSLASAFALLLARYCGQREILLGSPIANRNRAEIEPIIGVFLNTLVLRLDLSQDAAGGLRWPRLLERVRSTALEAYAHQDAPFERLVDMLGPRRELDHSPLFEVLFMVHNVPAAPVGLAGLECAPVETTKTEAKLDLSLAFYPASDGLDGELIYRADLFDASRIERMAGHLETLLGEIARAPDRPISSLPLLSRAQRQQIVVEWNDTRSRASDSCLHRLFERQAARTPDRVALVFENRLFSFGQLDRMANRLAGDLIGRGVVRGECVPVLMAPCPEILMALLGVLKTGGVYTPLDPSWPRERVAAILAGLGSSALVIADPELARQWPRTVRVKAPSAADQAPPPDVAVAAEDAIYAIYTSGSTGAPKAAVNTHAGIANRFRWMGEHFGRDRNEVVLQTTHHTFDSSVWQLLWPLLHGARSVIPTRADGFDVDDLSALVARQRVTFTDFVPSVLDVVVRQLEESPRLRRSLTGLRQVIVGGEAVSPPTVGRFRALLPRVRVTNLYGPTETAIGVTCHEIREPADGPVPIGRPIDRVVVRILDPDLSPAPVGVAGEIYLGGVCVGLGYLDDPRQSAVCFIADPLSGTAGGRLYKTGDLGRYRIDGNVEFLGRVDQQVKIRGFRVEPGEIESALRQHSAVSEAAVTVVDFSDASTDRGLVACVVADRGQIAGGDLRAFLHDKLPGYMVPSEIIFLEILPLTATGKLDRGELGRLAAARNPRRAAGPKSGRRRLEPGVAGGSTSSIGEIVAGIWKEVLGVPDIGPEDDFFEAGGHSLLATRITARVRRVFGIELPLRVLFEEPTVVGLAEHVARALQSPGAAASTPPIRGAAGAGEAPLSFAQRRLWRIQHREPESAVYNSGVAWRLEGRLDASALERALGEIVRRHEVLRTTFPAVGGRPVQRIGGFSGWRLPRIDLTAVARRRARVREILSRESARSFDLERETPLRAMLLRCSLDEHFLLVNMHHIASDARSWRIFKRELGGFYHRFAHDPDGGSAVFPAPAVQPADFARWQQRQVREGRLEAELAYWRRQLAGLPAVGLPADRPGFRSRRGPSATVSLGLPEALTKALAGRCAASAVSLYMAMVATLMALLSRLSGRQDVVLGTSMSNRRGQELEDVVGFFVNNVVLRCDLSGDPTFHQLLERVRSVCLGAHAHRHLPYEKVVAELDPARDPSRDPLFRVYLNFLRDEGEVPEAGSGSDAGERVLRFERVPIPTSPSTRLDLALRVGAAGGRLLLNFVYNAARFDRTRIEGLSRSFRILLTAAVADADRPLSALPVLDAATGETAHHADGELSRLGPRKR